MVEPIRGYGVTARRAARGPAGFRLAESEAPSHAAAIAPMAGLGVGVPPPALTPEERDATAARRGHALLQELAGLQAGLLAGRLPESALRRMAALAEGEAGHDPALRELLEGIALRARVTLARLGR